MEEKIPNLAGPQLSPEKKWYKKWWAIVIYFALLITMVLFVVFFIAVYQWIQKIDEEQNTQLTNQAIVQVGADNDPSRGPENAKVTIIAFEDFACSHCEESYPVIKELLSTYGNQIHFVFRDYPALDGSQKAHEAAECANEQGGFWAMHDKIFQNQSNITITDLKQYAKEIGLDTVIFDNCLDSGKYEAEVTKDLTDGIVAGVEGTPTWFINGRKFAGSIPLESFKQIIDYYLQSE